MKHFLEAAARGEISREEEEDARIGEEEQREDGNKVEGEGVSKQTKGGKMEERRTRRRGVQIEVRKDEGGGDNRRGEEAKRSK